MKTLFLGLFMFGAISLIHSQTSAPPDSILKKVEGLENVSAIKLIVKKHGNDKVKSEGWAYLFQDGNKTKFVRLGHWKYYSKDGTLEFEDFMPIDDKKPILERHYDKEGVLIKERYVAQEFDKTKNLTGKTYREVYFYPNGNVKHRNFYKNKKKVGTWVWFDEGGDVKNQKVYDPA